MSMRYPLLRQLLILVLSLAIASYVSVVSRELMADDYEVITGPEDPVDNPDLLFNTQDLDPGNVASIHREKITTRTVNCVQNCSTGKGGEWGAFVDVSYQKQEIPADPSRQRPASRSKDRILTAGVDRLFGKHLLGFSLAASSGDGKSGLVLDDGGPFQPGSPGNPDFALSLDRDKHSAGIYYGVSLPYFISFSAQLMASDYSYSARWRDPRFGADDAARYDGDDWSGAVALTAIVPMISLTPRFEFLLQPTISYQYVDIETDPYTSKLLVEYAARNQHTKNLEYSLLWRVPRFADQTVFTPYGGFAWSSLDRSIRTTNALGEPVRIGSDHDLFEMLVGLTVQRGNLSSTLSLKKTIGSDDLDREVYQLMFRLRF